MAVTLDAAVSAFGASLKAKLSNAAIQGAPEDQLRAPLEKLMADLAEAVGLPAGALGLVGETTLGAMRTRLDYALVALVEVKALGEARRPA